MVILLDNDDEFRNALAMNLVEDGHHVKQYKRPFDVPPLESLEGVCMLIVDQHLDQQSGISFADGFHRVHPSVPVVLITVFANDHLNAEVTARDFITLLFKPIDYENLTRLLTHAR